MLSLRKLALVLGSIILQDCPGYTIKTCLFSSPHRLMSIMERNGKEISTAYACLSNLFWNSADCFSMLVGQQVAVLSLNWKIPKRFKSCNWKILRNWSLLQPRDAKIRLYSSYWVASKVMMYFSLCPCKNASWFANISKSCKTLTFFFFFTECS